MTHTEKSSKTLDDDEVLEGAIFNVRQTRYLKIIVIVMGVMLVFGFVALAIAVMNKASKRKTAQKTAISTTQPDQKSVDLSSQNLTNMPPLAKEIQLDLPKKAKILSYKMSGTLMILHVKAKGLNQIIVLDMTTGKIKSRIHLPQ